MLGLYGRSAIQHVLNSFCTEMAVPLAAQHVLEKTFVQTRIPY